jgi:hypothetical protein
MLIALLLLLMVAPMVDGSAMPGLKIITVRRWPGRLPDRNQTEFIQTDRKRTEGRDKLPFPSGSEARIWVQGPRTASIVRCDLGLAYALNLDNRTYTSAAYPWPPVPTEAERRAYADRVSKEPARKPTISVEINTVDTGERKEIFGHTARHVVTTRRDVPLEGSAHSLQEYVTDGWYIELDTRLACDPKPPAGSFYYGFATLSVNGQLADVPVLKLIGKPETGFALSTKMTSLPRDAGETSKDQHASVYETEVVGLSVGPLDPALFEIPAGFVRVDRMDYYHSMPFWIRWLSQAHIFWLRFKIRISRLWPF